MHARSAWHRPGDSVEGPEKLSLPRCLDDPKRGYLHSTALAEGAQGAESCAGGQEEHVPRACYMPLGARSEWSRPRPLWRKGS